MQLLAEPIEAAPQSLQDRISYLESIIVQLKEENAAMAATQAHLIDNQEIQLRLIHELKGKRKGIKTPPLLDWVKAIQRSRQHTGCSHRFPDLHPAPLV